MRRGLLITLLPALCVTATALLTGPPGLAAAKVRTDQARSRPTLTILTTTLGGVGTFGYIPGPYDDDPTHVSATTTQAGVPVRAAPEGNLRLLSTNRYTIQQLPPATATGHWELVRVACNGTRRKISREPIDQVRYVRLRLRFGRPTVCSFVNRLIRSKHPSA